MRTAPSIEPRASQPGSARTRGRWSRLAVLVPTAAALLALLAVVALRVVPRDEGVPITSAPAVRLVPDCEGTIVEWSLGLHGARSPFFLPTQAELVSKADAHIRFRVAYAEREARAGLERELRARGFSAFDRIRWVQAPQGASPWLRDFWIAGRRADGAARCLLPHPDRYSGMRGAYSRGVVPPFVERLTEGCGVPTTVRVEGGVVVVDEERAFASPTPLQEALARHETPSREAFQRSLAATWGLPVEILRPDVPGQDFHADLYLAPVGGRRVVLGSPRLALSLLEGISREERAHFQRAVQDFAARSPAGHPLPGLAQADVLDALVEVNDAPGRLQAFGTIRRQLEALGYTCFEVPFLLLAPSRTGARLALSWTNVIQDTRAGKRVVYLPTARLPTLDGAAAETWRRLGFRVVRIDALGPALNGGGLRCLSQVVRE